MFQEDRLKMIGIITGLIIVVVLVTVIVVTSFKGDENKEGEVDQTGDVDEGEIVTVQLENEGVELDIPEDMVETALFYDQYMLTEEEQETIVKERVERYVDPYEHDNRLYIFYDRDKAGSEALIEVAEDYIDKENIPYTVYHMNFEEGLVFGMQVLEELGYAYEVGDGDGVILIKMKDKEIDVVMRPSTFSEKELKGE